MSNFISVQIVTASRAEGDKIARALIEEKLAACVNIIPAVQSFYRWQDKIEESAEVILLAKTRNELFEPLRKFVKALHSHECPCIIATPLTQGHGPYLDWIAAQTAK